MKTETSPAMELLPLLCLCLLTRSGVTSAQLNGPENIKVEGGADVVLPCSLSTKENIESKLFDWRKVAQKDDGQKEVFLYHGGDHYNNGLRGQSEEFKGRVSHFPDELKHGNASIIITNTKISDSGNYTCYFPRLQPPQIFHIQLVVEPHDKVTVVEDSDVILPCSLSTKENIESKEFHWKKVAQKDPTNVLVYNGRIDNYLQHKDFIGRVFHFQDELKHGNASIIIRNTTISDSGVYICDFPRLQPSQTFYIELVVGVSLEPSVTSLEVTKNWARLQCQVKGASPKPEVEWQDSDGKKLPASSNPGGPDDIILLTTVTKTGNYSCVVTQRELNHQTTSQIHVYIQEFSTGWTVALVLLALVGLLALLALLALAVLVYMGYIILNRNKGPGMVQMQPQEKPSCDPENQSSSTHTYEIPNHVRGQKQNPSCARGTDEGYEIVDDVIGPSKENQSNGSTPEPNALHPFMMEERH